MKRIVLGTAGHIDHGKTLLTKALTGVDCDRLAEEKARGITIELGFAPMVLPDGTKISLVDVPGHEKFVRTMMSGVSGIDGVLLVIAADDGVMPQTREHLDILRLLDVKNGICALTKTDLVNGDRIAEVTAQVTELVRGTFLENAPICPVSAHTGEGMEELRREIAALVASAEERNYRRPFRLPVDRVFPVEGFGTVVTGTLTEGTLRTGDKVEVGQYHGTVRTLQTHGKDQTEVQAGSRVAVSFSGMEKDALQRGVTVSEPGSLIWTDRITAELHILPDCPHTIRNSSQLHFFHGTEELTCKLRLLDRDVLRAGDRGYGQLMLSRSIPLRWDDRFLLRFFSPVLTVGGGTVLACNDDRLRRKHPRVLQRLERLSLPHSRTVQRVADRGLHPVPPDMLRKQSNLSPEEFSSGDGLLAISARGLLAEETVKAAQDNAVAALEKFHGEYPLQPGMSLAHWRGLFRDPEIPADDLADYWCDQGIFSRENGHISLPGFAPVFTREHLIMQRKLLHYYRDAWFFAPDLKAVKEKFGRFGTLFEQVLANMRMEELLIPLTPRYWVHHEAYRAALDILNELGTEGKPVTLGQFRTAADISRKYSQLFLEYWDRKGVTRRMGDTHILL